jgi:hypothetical protein
MNSANSRMRITGISHQPREIVSKVGPIAPKPIAGGSTRYAIIEVGVDRANS